MNSSELRDKVLELETYPKDLKNRIREEIVHTKERPLKASGRLGVALQCVAAGVMLLGLAIGSIVYLDVFIKSGHATFILVCLSASALIVCWLFGMSIVSLKKGTKHFRNESFFVYGVFGLVLCLVVHKMLSNSLTVDGVAALIVLGVCVIATLIESSELRLRERVLRNELALAELAELIRNERGE